MNYREIIEERLEEKEKMRKAHRMMTRLFVISSSIIFTTLLFVWISRGLPEITIPTSFYWNTLIIIASSFFLNQAVNLLSKDELEGARGWIGVTLALGLAFGIIQISGWREIIVNNQQYLNMLLPVTALHFGHLLVALILLAMARIKIRKVENHSKEPNFTRNVSLFWHFLSVIWVLFILIF